MNKLPSFFIIGAMKSATSSLYEQLVEQPGIFMSTPKEPNYFSDDDNYAKGLDWYQKLFIDAKEGDLIGEASTHYTKLPTYANTASRMYDDLLSPRLIYVMRDPVDRLISQYIHEWSQGLIKCPIDEAIEKYPELAAYSMYSMQLKPFIELFGKQSILPVFFDRIKREPQQELNRICEFIGYKGSPVWRDDLTPSNISRERIKRFPLFDLLIDSSPATWLRRNFIPRSWRNKVKSALTMNQRPQISSEKLERLHNNLDKDLTLLGTWFGVEINCKNFSEVTASTQLDWKL
jgi:hypothetical protein